MIEITSRLLSTTAFAISNPRAILAKMRGARARVFDYLSRGLIKEFEIATVLDVGAHTGEWAKAARLADERIKILAFEPLPACARIAARRMAGDAGFRMFNVALGSEERRVPFLENKQISSSSVLSVAEDFCLDGKRVETASIHDVEMTTLDRALSREEIGSNLLLKLDVQGYELEVLKGAERTLNSTNVVIAETSFVEFYEKQALHCDVTKSLERNGFSYCGALAVVLRGIGGIVLQQDSLYINTKRVDIRRIMRGRLGSIRE